MPLLVLETLSNQALIGIDLLQELGVRITIGDEQIFPVVSPVELPCVGLRQIAPYESERMENIILQAVYCT